MAYTSVNNSVNHLIRLLSSRNLIFSKESQIPMLKLELIFLRTFLWWTSKRSRENENSELLLQIEVVVRNAVSHLLNDVEDIAEDLDQWSPKVLHHIRLLKPETDMAYIKFAKSSPPVPDTLLVVEFMNNLIDNFKNLLCYGDSSTFSAREELIQLVTMLRFLRNLLSFVATRSTDHEKLKDLSNLAEGIAIEAACLPFMCSFNQNDGNNTTSIKGNLTELTRKIKPIVPDITRIYVGVLEELSPVTTEAGISDPELASFIDTLQDCLTELQDELQPPWIDSLKVNFEALHHELTFLSSYAKDPPNQFIENDKSDDPIQLLLGEMRDWSSTSDAHPFKHYTQHLTLKGQFIRFQDLAVKVGCTIFFFFNFNEMEEHKLAEAEATLVDLIEKIKQLKSEIGVGPMPEVKTVRIDELGFIRDLRELLDRQAGPVDCLKHRVQGIADELEFLSCFLKKYGERPHEHEKPSDLAAQIMTVAYRAEYVVDSLLARDGTLFFHSLCFINVIGEMKRIRREVMVFDEKMRYVIESIMFSRDMESIAMPEELVGFEEDMQKLTQYLIRGSRELSVVSILGSSGQGKTTIAMCLYRNEHVVRHFDICAAVSASQVYDTEIIVRAILHNITGYPDTSNVGNVAHLTDKLRKSLIGRRFFVLIDDIAVWDGLRKLFPDDSNGSRILITTRSYQIASYAAYVTEVHNLRFLTPDESWELFNKKTFQQHFCPQELGEAGNRIVMQCRGKPAMIVWIADILARKRTEAYWLQVEQSNLIDEYLITHAEQEYSHLHNHLRQCFLYFGAFPLEEEISVSKLIRLWAADGFIQQTEAEDVAMDYLMELIEQRFVMVSQRSSDGMVKRCKVHDRLHKFCLAKSNHENFFQLMEGYGDISTTPLGVDPNDSNTSLSLTCEHRRLFISSNLLDNISLEASGPLVRSLVLTGRRYDFPRPNVSSLYHNFKLVRVLDLGGINVGNDFPVGVEKLILLKYLEVRGEMTSIPSSIGSLQELETFVTIGLKGEVSVPDSIWSLTNLRHLHINNIRSSSDAHDYEQQMLPNVRTMSTLVLSYGEDSEEILRRLVRVEKLKCIFLESWDSLRKKNLFPKLGLLDHVHSLKLFYDGEVRKTCEFNFPVNLKRLTLSHFRLPWDQISIIGKLPKLEVLKLLNKAFEGSEWEEKDYQFPSLKLLKLDTLDLEEWHISEDALPRLERLKLQKCKKLEEIPFCFAYIPTLKEIEVKWCSQSVEASARRIRQDVEEMTGEDSLKVFIHHPPRQ